MWYHLKLLEPRIHVCCNQSYWNFCSYGLLRFIKFVTYDLACFGFNRFGLPPTGWDIAGSTTRSSSLPSANAFHNTHSPSIHRGHMDCKHSWLHTRQVMACNGCWLSYHTPHHLSSQLWPLHNMDGLDVRNSSRSPRWRGQEDITNVAAFVSLEFGRVPCVSLLCCFIMSKTLFWGVGGGGNKKRKRSSAS